LAGFGGFGALRFAAPSASAMRTCGRVESNTSTTLNIIGPAAVENSDVPAK
jgi:hypothetical protein